MFDRQIGDAAARIDDIGRGEGVGGAGGQAGGATAAMVAFRAVGGERQFRVDGPQEQPASS